MLPQNSLRIRAKTTNLSFASSWQKSSSCHAVDQRWRDVQNRSRLFSPWDCHWLASRGHHSSPKSTGRSQLQGIFDVPVAILIRVIVIASSWVLTPRQSVDQSGQNVLRSSTYIGLILPRCQQTHNKTLMDELGFSRAPKNSSVLGRVLNWCIDSYSLPFRSLFLSIRFSDPPFPSPTTNFFRYCRLFGNIAAPYA